MVNDHFFIAFYFDFLSQPHLQMSKTQTFNLHLNTTFFGITQVTL